MRRSFATLGKKATQRSAAARKRAKFAPRLSRTHNRTSVFKPAQAIFDSRSAFLNRA
jgi:hypothetical protein